MLRAFLLLLVALSSFAQTGTISGVVTLKANNTPLHHANVLLIQLKRTAQTGEDGRFVFRQVPPGTYDVVAHMHTLTDQRQTVTVAANGTAEIAFQLAIASVRQEITVTASGETETTFEAVQTVTSVEGRDLLTRAAAPSLGELLENETGIAKRSFGPGSARPVVRGFDGDRVLVLQDGVRSGTLSSQSGDHGEPIDPTSLERVEVVRGPGTLLYGSNAIGGVVNVISSHHQLDQHPHEGVRGQITGVGGSNNGLGGGSGSFEFGLGDWLIWGGGGGQRTGDYKTPIGRIDNSGSSMRHADGGFGRYSERGSFTVNYGAQDGSYGVPFAAQFEGGQDPVDLDWRRHNVRLNGMLKQLGPLIDQFSATIGYTDWNHKEISGGQIGTEFFNKQLTYQGMFQQKHFGVYSGSFGFWGMHRDFKSVGAEALAPPVIQNAIAGFALQELGFEHVRLQFGARLENNRYDPRGLPSRSFTGVSGGIGAYVPLWHGGAFVTNLSSSYRAPALEELYNNGPHIGNLAFEIGNPSLLRERSNGIEIALRHRTDRFHAEANAFYYRFRDFVFLAPTGEIEDGLIEADYLQARTRYMGAEAKVDTRLHERLWLNLGFDTVDAQIRNTRTPLPRIPPVRGRIGLDYNNNGFGLRPEIVLSNAQYQLFPTETRTAGFAVFNLTGSYTIAKQHYMHTFTATLFNGTDRLYRNHLSLIKEFAPEIGRGVRFSYTLNFY